MGCLNESGMSQVLGETLVKDVEWRIRELVLATDITRQKEFLDKLKVSMLLHMAHMDNAYKNVVYLLYCE